MQRLFFFFLILHLQVVRSSSSSSSILCSPEQSVALLHFKNTFSLQKNASSVCYLFNQFSGYPKTESWKEGSDCCFWDGVTCDRFTGHVIDLDLSSSWLVGSINENSSLFLLHYLQKLNLACNDFSRSEISPKFGKFTKLTHLNISYSNLFGVVPTEMFLQSDLISLDLSNCDLLDLFLFDLSNYDLFHLISPDLSSYDQSTNRYSLSMDQHGFNKLLHNLTKLKYLHLDSVNMSTVSVSSLVNLSSSLISLSLWNTEMQGKFPNEIFLFPFLQRLRLSKNKDMTGNLPEFNKSSLLRLLDMSLTSFSGKLPDTFGNLMYLNYLSFRYCNFHGSLPPSLGNLTEITHMDLSSNGFIGPIPYSIFQLSNLTVLTLAKNNFSGTMQLEMLSELKNLRSIDLSHNALFSLTGKLILPQLELLLLSSCSITVVSIFLCTSSLQKLDLSNNTISGQISQLEIGNCSELFDLDLSSNLLQGQLVDLPTHISVFSASNNHLTGEIPQSYCNLSAPISLDLSHNYLSGNIPQCLMNSSEWLMFLNLAMNNFHGSIGSLTFPNQCGVTGLMINDNQLEGPLPSSLVNCQTLNILDVGNNWINDSFPNWLVNFQHLEILVLRSNQFHGPIGNSSTRFFFNYLQVLDISHNQFSGILPTSLFNSFEGMMSGDVKVVNLHYMQSPGGSYYSIKLCVKGVETKIERILSIFTSIDISNNLFEGEIPKMIGQLKSLRLLNFSHNSLIGEIPSSLKNLSQLEALDLSSNQLHGKIPIQLTSLTFLSVLNLSYNYLVGSIPQGYQFDTFQNNSYVGNLGLCGPPLSDKYDNDKASPTIDQEENNPSSWFDWKIALMGYGSGFVIGISIAYIVFSTGKPQFLVRLIERGYPRNVRMLNRRHLRKRN